LNFRQITAVSRRAVVLCKTIKDYCAMWQVGGKTASRTVLSAAHLTGAKAYLQTFTFVRARQLFAFFNRI
jgi:hypothetical protein